MAGTSHVYAGIAGTVGTQHAGNLAGVFRQEVGGGKWERLGGGLPEDAEVHAITVHPADHDTIYVGSTKGLYRSANRGGKFERLPLPDAEADIWSVLVHPKDPRRIYAGATPIAVYRSDDGGDHWKKLADPGLPNRVIMAFACIYSWLILLNSAGVFSFAPPLPDSGVQVLSYSWFAQGTSSYVINFRLDHLAVVHHRVGGRRGRHPRSRRVRPRALPHRPAGPSQRRHQSQRPPRQHHRAAGDGLAVGAHRSHRAGHRCPIDRAAVAGRAGGDVVSRNGSPRAGGSEPGGSLKPSGAERCALRFGHRRERIAPDGGGVTCAC